MPSLFYLTTPDNTGSFSLLFLDLLLSMVYMDSRWFTRAINSAGDEKDSSVDDIGSLLKASTLASS